VAHRGREGIVSNFSERVSFIWSVADLLRGPYKPAQYGKVILPLTVLRRLDCVLQPTKQKVLDKAAGLKASGIKDVEPILNRIAGHKFHNTSRFDFRKLKGRARQGCDELGQSHEALLQCTTGLRAGTVGRSRRQTGTQCQYRSVRPRPIPVGAESATR
jgi:type I restriction-modification system DNA methylase subunit